MNKNNNPLLNATYELERAKTQEDISIFNTSGAGAHFHPQVEMLCVSDGEIKTTINNEEYILTRGGIAIANSFDVHTFEIIKENSVGTIIIIPKNLLKQYTKKTNGLGFSSNFLINDEAFSVIEPLIMLAKNHGNNFDENFNASIISSILSVLNKYLSQENSNNTKKNQDVLMRDILAYIHDNYDTELSLLSLTKKFGYSLNYFSSLFNDYTQMSLTDYINKIRVEYSLQQILQGETIINAAMNCGFNSVRTFYRAFKKRYNQNPKDYIANHK